STSDSSSSRAAPKCSQRTRNSTSRYRRMPESDSACWRVGGRPGTSSLEPSLIDDRLVIRHGVDAHNDRPVLPLGVRAEPHTQSEPHEPQARRKTAPVILLVVRPLPHPLPAHGPPFQVGDGHPLRPVIAGPGDPALKLLRVAIEGKG